MGGRLLVMVKPDAETAGRIHDMTRAQLAPFNRRPYPAELLHVTLFSLYTGPVLPEALSARATRGAGLVRTSPFEVEFDRIGIFRSGRHIGLTGGKNHGLAALCAGIATAFGRVSLAHRMVARRPHVTLLYDRRAVRPWPLPEPVHWTVRDFRLVWSRTGTGQHDEIGRWALDVTAPVLSDREASDVGETPAR